MKPTLILSILLFFQFNTFSQPAIPKKAGTYADFVGVVTHSGMIEGYFMFTLYCEDIRKEVTFHRGFGIKNPPKVTYGRFGSILEYIDKDCRECINYVVRVKAISVYQQSFGEQGYDLVWSPVRITLISRCEPSIQNDASQRK